METKFTDKFFCFPIKIYDGKTLSVRFNDGDVESDETEGEGLIPQIDGDWIIGQVRLSRKDLDNILWYDGYSSERTVKEVNEKGFDSTVIVSPDYGQFNCTWSRKKFEEKLNEFVGKMDEQEQEKHKAQDEYEARIRNMFREDRVYNPGPPPNPIPYH